MTFNILQTKTQLNEHDKSEIYGLKRNTCNKWYRCQTKIDFKVRHKEHIRYTKHNPPQSAYAAHTLGNEPKYGPIKETKKLMKTCTKVKQMNCWEALYMHNYRQQGQPIKEHETLETSPLFRLTRHMERHEAT